MKIYEFSTYEEYFSKYLDVISATKVPEDNKLTQREKEFLISCMISECKGIDINSRRGIKFVEEHSRCKNKDVYGYKKKLFDKKWLIPVKGGYTLPDILNCNTNKGIIKGVKFNFSLVYGEPKSGVQQEGS